MPSLMAKNEWIGAHPAQPLFPEYFHFKTHHNERHPHSFTLCPQHPGASRGREELTRRRPLSFCIPSSFTKLQSRSCAHGSDLRKEPNSLFKKTWQISPHSLSRLLGSNEKHTTASHRKRTWSTKHKQIQSTAN